MKPTITKVKAAELSKLDQAYEWYCAEVADGMCYEAWMNIYTGWQALQAKYNADPAAWTDADEHEIRFYEAQLGL